MQSPSDLDAPVIHDAMTAPIIYIDGTSNCGFGNGVVNLTLVVNRFLPRADGGVSTATFAAAHIRCHLAAAVELRNTLDRAILMAAPPSGRS